MTAQATVGEPLGPLARNVRNHRRQRGLSLSALGREAGISKSTLSDLERGRGNPSIDTLWSLAKALRIPFAALFEEDGARSISVLRFEDAPVVASEGTGFRTRHLMSRHGQSEAELYLIELEPGFRRRARPHSPGVVEHVVVMEGSVEVGPVDEAEILGPGDSMQFPADVPHGYAAADGAVRLLALHLYP